MGSNRLSLIRHGQQPTNLGISHFLSSLRIFGTRLLECLHDNINESRQIDGTNNEFAIPSRPVEDCELDQAPHQQLLLYTQLEVA